jgi:hypothetical protein
MRVAVQVHVLIVVLCCCQIVWLMVYELNGSVITVSIFLSAARVIMYWIFSVMLYSWATIVRLQINKTRSGTIVVASKSSSHYSSKLRGKCNDSHQESMKSIENQYFAAKLSFRERMLIIVFILNLTRFHHKYRENT